ncbi:MAG: MGMT family protein, partial [Clostridia bacterium]|nr:MGMT family protein [Clostridia bacterium]
AHMTGNPRAARAVGNAIHRNRLLILIPCHRIIQGDGSLGGYAGREDIKRYLLNLEKF